MTTFKVTDRLEGQHLVEADAFTQDYNGHVVFICRVTEDVQGTTVNKVVDVAYFDNPIAILKVA